MQLSILPLKIQASACLVTFGTNACHKSPMEKVQHTLSPKDLLGRGGLRVVDLVVPLGKCLVIPGVCALGKGLWDSKISH
jgi:hypothetical protein